MDPDGTRIVTLKSPNYPSNYPNNKDCTWKLTTTSGNIKMLLDKFNIQWSSSCKAKDYLFVSGVNKYTKLWLCGSTIPSNFVLKSKKKSITVKFHSNGSTRKSGFKARFIAG